MVCTQTGNDMHDMFHKKCGTLFKMDDTPWRDSNDKLQGLVLEIDCDYTLRKLMICGPCHASYITDKKYTVDVNKIVYRFWKEHIYPSVMSCLHD